MALREAFASLRPALLLREGSRVSAAASGTDEHGEKSVNTRSDAFAQPLSPWCHCVLNQGDSSTPTSRGKRCHCHHP